MMDNIRMMINVWFLPSFGSMHSPDSNAQAGSGPHLQSFLFTSLLLSRNYTAVPGSTLQANRSRGLPSQLSQERICLQCRKPGFDPWVENIPWRRKWQPTPVFLPGESHGQRSLMGYSPWGHKESETTLKLNHSRSRASLSSCLYIILLSPVSFENLGLYRQ